MIKIKPNNKHFRSQAAIDFITSYGFAILFITIAIYVVFQIGIINYRIVPEHCYSIPSINCVSYAINTTGGLTMVISQNTGGTMKITGAGCSSLQNNSGNGPAYGNVKMKDYSNNPKVYPNTEFSNTLIVYPNSKVAIFAYCYNQKGIAAGPLGDIYNGYVWINYTYSQLPSNAIYIVDIASLSMKYT